MPRCHLEDIPVHQFIVKNTFIDVVSQGDTPAPTPRGTSSPPAGLRRRRLSTGLASEEDGDDIVERPLTSRALRDRSDIDCRSSATTCSLQSGASASASAASASGRSASDASPASPVASGTAADGASEGGCASSHASHSGEAESDGRTAVMLRNLPQSYTRDLLLETLDTHGFCGKYDFVYMPVAFGLHYAFGYALINLVTYADAVAFKSFFEGFSQWLVESPKVAEVEWSKSQQGKDQLVERYRDSPVMHEDVIDDFKPIIFADGRRVDFPLPTKPVSALRGRCLNRRSRRKNKADQA